MAVLFLARQRVDSSFPCRFINTLNSPPTLPITRNKLFSHYGNASGEAIPALSPLDNRQTMAGNIYGRQHWWHQRQF
ncbi:MULTISPECIES: hypothetical protein [Dickeya]|uniref:hypothetical protein n=1 Tax=Dickeya TaxID=204037 RepID=UPI0013145BA4|nr:MULTISPECIES: hypothetical protein [Dickeya]